MIIEGTYERLVYKAKADQPIGSIRMFHFIFPTALEQSGFYGF